MGVSDPPCQSLLDLENARKDPVMLALMLKDIVSTNVTMPALLDVVNQVTKVWVLPTLLGPNLKLSYSPTPV